jgi:ABC-type Fe3+-hydroxamate transport system substrate-binding protein
VKRLAALVLLFGCDAGRPPVPGVLVVDGRGKSVSVPASPRRIVSIVPSATELLYAVGAGEQVAAVTTYCLFPEAAKAKPKVGDIVVDLERLAAARPDLIVGSWDVARKTVELLETRGHPVFTVDPTGVEDVAIALRSLGKLTGHEKEGDRAAETFLARIRAVPERAGGPTFYFEHSADPIGTTGPSTYTGEVLRRAGGRNVIEGGWRQLVWEVVLAKDPEVILIAHDRLKGLERRAGWTSLRAVRAGRVYPVALEGFIFPTPRLADGLEEAARIFHAKTP